MDDTTRRAVTLAGVLLGLCAVTAGAVYAIVTVPATADDVALWSYADAMTGNATASVAPPSANASSPTRDDPANETIALHAADGGTAETPPAGPLALGVGISLAVVGWAAVLVAPMATRSKAPPAGHRHALRSKKNGR